jgi:hypothetical protein
VEEFGDFFDFGTHELAISCWPFGYWQRHDDFLVSEVKQKIPGHTPGILVFLLTTYFLLLIPGCLHLPKAKS